MSKEQYHQPARLTLDDVARKAQEVLLEDGYHVPTLILERDGQATVTQVNPMAETSAARVEQLQRVGFMLAQQEDVVIPQQVFFITEGWMSMVDKDQKHPSRPSEDPHRKEVLLVTVLDMRERGSSTSVFEMSRDDEQRLSALHPLQMGEDERMDSPLIEAFVQGFAMGLLDQPRD